MSTTTSETVSADPASVTAPACCAWRAALQMPLLLCVAGGLAFAGQHAWQNRSDFQAFLSIGGGVPGGHCAMSATGCGASSAGCAHNCPSSGCQQDTLAAVTELEEESLSALLPDNAPISL